MSVLCILVPLPPGQKKGAYERQHGICPYCEQEGNMKRWDIKEIEADHITPWLQGGHVTVDNCKMLCKAHNRKKSVSKKTIYRCLLWA